MCLSATTSPQHPASTGGPPTLIFLDAILQFLIIAWCRDVELLISALEGIFVNRHLRPWGLGPPEQQWAGAATVGPGAPEPQLATAAAAAVGPRAVRKESQQNHKMIQRKQK